MDIVKETIKELRNLGISGTLSNVIITRLAPWTLSYVRYDSGMIGCGVANNEAEAGNVPDDVAFIGDLLNLDVYDVVGELEHRESSVFINSLLASIASALSYSLMNDEDALKERYHVETYVMPNAPLLTPSKFVKNTDVVAMVGFHPQATPLCAEVAKEVHVTELMDLKKLSVVDFDREESNIRIFPAEKSEEVLSGADVVYITGETIVNGTFEDVLRFSRNARLRILYGPTSAFYPKVLFDRGVDISLPVIFPNSLDFRQRFVRSRGWWYSMRDVKSLVIKRRFHDVE